MNPRPHWQGDFDVFLEQIDFKGSFIEYGPRDRIDFRGVLDRRSGGVGAELWD